MEVLPSSTDNQEINALTTKSESMPNQPTNQPTSQPTNQLTSQPQPRLTGIRHKIRQLYGWDRSLLSFLFFSFFFLLSTTICFRILLCIERTRIVSVCVWMDIYIIVYAILYINLTEHYHRQGRQREQSMPFDKFSTRYRVPTYICTAPLFIPPSYLVGGCAIPNTGWPTDRGGWM